MNKLWRFLICFIGLLAGFFVSAYAQAQTKKAAGGEEFLIVSSIDQTKSQILLKRPTEVTQLMKVNDRTQIFDANNKPLHLSDLRAGDTVWATSVAGSNGDLLAVRMRKGPMTVEELHRYFLDYPVIK